MRFSENDSVFIYKMLKVADRHLWASTPRTARYLAWHYYERFERLLRILVSYQQSWGFHTTEQQNLVSGMISNVLILLMTIEDIAKQMRNPVFISQQIQNESELPNDVWESVRSYF